jgi:hypothetical protein
MMARATRAETGFGPSEDNMRIAFVVVLLALMLAIARRRACRNAEREQMSARLEQLAL